MEAALVVVEPVIEETVGSTCAIIGRQIGYVCEYSQNIENLRRNITALEIVHRNVQTKIDRAKNKGDSVWKNVWDWSEKAVKIEAEAYEFLEGQGKNDNRCLKGLFPNIKSRYRLGKGAVKRTEVVAKHEELGKKFEGAVISDPAPPPNLRFMHGSSDYQIFESRRSAREEIMKALKDETIQRIGIWGMGGVGKTTMVAEVGDEAKRDHLFDEVLMAVVSQDPKVTDIQKTLAAQLKLEMKDNEAAFNITGSLYNRLKNGKNLVILDDVWKKLNLNNIGIPSPDEARDCKVLLTTREKSVIQQVQKLIPVKVLCREEAWNLFEKKVGDAIHSHDEMLVVAKNVCNQCGGLPVAILAIAGALKDESKDNWEYVLSRLRESKLENIYEDYREVRVCLELSYNHLQSKQAKSCFLFCSLFPEDFDIPVDSLMRLGRGMRILDDMTATLRIARRGIGVLVDDLKKRSLLLEGKDSKHVKMHDVVRDVAISIASEGHRFLIGENLQQWPERKPYDFYNVISLTSDEDYHELPYGFEYPKLHTIMLKCKWKSEWPSSRIHIPDTFFNKITKIQVLTLKDMKISSLPLSMKFLDDLRVLCLVDCDLGDVSLVGELKKLEMLILHGSKIHVLPTEVRYLTHLKLLDMRSCKYLKIISPNVLLHLAKLEELFMPMNFGMWGHGAINDAERSADLTELKELNQLESLEIHVPNFEMLPQQSYFPFWGKLTMFKISVQTFLIGEENEQSKNVMKLEGVPLTRGLDLLLKRVEALYIKRLKGLRDFNLQSGDKESFPHLEDLQAVSCEGMQEFMATVLERPILAKPPVCKLSVLKIISCNLRKLLSPSAAKALVLLRTLEIEDCENIEVVVWRNDEAPIGRGQAKETIDMIIFPQLEYLKLKDLPKLVSFYPKMNPTGLVESLYFPAQPLFNDKVAFPKLEELVIDNVGECKEIGLHLLAQESASKLRVLRVVTMNHLSTIGSSTLIPKLQNLQELFLRECGSMKAVFKAERRQISDGEGIVHEKAVAVECFEFPALRKLHIEGCCLLEEFCSSEGFPSIEEREETTFFHNRIGFPNLRELWLVKMENVKEIWMDSIRLPPLDSFCNLTRLFIRKCPKLERVIPPSILPRLHHLRSLIVRRCDSVREVIEVVGVGSEVVEQEKGHGAFSVLPKLNSISLINLPNLENLPWGKAVAAGGGSVSSPHSSFLAFQCLSRIIIIECGRLRNLFSSPSTPLAFPAPHNLSILRITYCEKMEEIVSCWGSMGKEVDVAGSYHAASSHGIRIIIFPHLAQLTLYHLPKLTKLCPSGCLLFQESSLKDKHIVGCPKLQALAAKSNTSGDE